MGAQCATVRTHCSDCLSAHMVTPPHTTAHAVVYCKRNRLVVDDVIQSFPWSRTTVMDKSSVLSFKSAKLFVAL
jgi:N-acetyl-anhydromuramyl-L-alanine amidase AmpD